MSKLFVHMEQKIILASTVTAELNPDYDTPAGNDTTDKVFLLSVNEVNRYFSDTKTCEGTPYCKEQGALLLGGRCVWWLRSPGEDPSKAFIVMNTGDSSMLGGFVVENASTAVRPALWIDISSIPD